MKYNRHLLVLYCDVQGCQYGKRDVWCNGNCDICPLKFKCYTTSTDVILKVYPDDILDIVNECGIIHV